MAIQGKKASELPVMASAAGSSFYGFDNTTATGSKRALGGSPNGLATLDSAGRGPQTQMALYTANYIGALSRAYASKLDGYLDVKDVGAIGNGVADDTAAFTQFWADSGLRVIPDGTYSLAAESKPLAQDMVFIAGGGTSFNGSKVDLENLVPFQQGPGPIWSQVFVSKTYGASWTGQGNVFQIGSHVTSDVAAVPVVASFGQGRGIAANSKVWGGNFVAYADHATATSIGIELNYGVLTAGGTAYGLVIASAGTAGNPQAAIQFQSNDVLAQTLDGLKFNWRNPDGLLTQNAIHLNGTTGATCQRFLYAHDVVASQGEIDIPSFAVEATVASTVNRVAVRGAATGNAPRITAGGADTNINLDIRAKGTGETVFVNNGVENFRVQAGTAVDSLQIVNGTGAGVLSVRGSTANADVVITGKGTGGSRLQDGAGANKIRVNTTGIGFFNNTPVARQTYGAPTGTATRTTFDTTTVTTQQLAERVKALIDDLRSYGLMA